MKTKKQKIKTIDVIAKEWFDKTYGNSYFSADIIVNYGMKDEITIKIPFQYGYEDHYRYVAFKTLQENGLVPCLPEYVPMWQYYRDNGIIVRYTKHTGCRKKDLYQL